MVWHLISLEPRVRVRGGFAEIGGPIAEQARPAQRRPRAARARG